ncbi:MAG: outer membrane beta-barrel protein [Erythrobacter sp.]
MRAMLIRRHFFATVALGALIFPSAQAVAQSTVAPLFGGDDPEYQIDPVTVGPVRISPQIRVEAVYYDNVLAGPDGTEVEDVEFIARPELVARIGDQTMQFEIDGYGEFSRFADFTTEDSDTYGVSGRFSYSPDASSRLSVNAGYARLKENRGDPEARDLAGPGPRLFDNTFAGATYRRTGGRMLLALEADYSDIDAVSPFDDDRDFKTYAGSATVGYSVAGPIYATVTGFVNLRDFRLEATPTDPDRDATTYGAQVGISFAESERFRGRARVGLFRFDPSDPALDPRTGFSANVALTYFPTRRLAFILEAFNGDVATFRRGARARTDTSVSLTGQAEIRHNLYGRTSFRYARNRFLGSGIEERTLSSNIGLEFLASRRLSFIAQVQASDRSSDDPTQAFNRLWGSVGVRFRF